MKFILKIYVLKTLNIVSSNFYRKHFLKITVLCVDINFGNGEIINAQL